MGLEREEEQQDRVGREGEEGKARGNGGDDGPASEQLGSAKEAPEGAFDDGKLVFTMRPVYPLVKRLERPWPVQVRWCLCVCVCVCIEKKNGIC